MIYTLSVLITVSKEQYLLQETSTFLLISQGMMDVDQENLVYFGI